MTKMDDLTTYPPFGRLTVLEQATQSVAGRIRWKCRCECGNIVIVTAAHLISGHTISCGCFRIDVLTTHGHTLNREMSAEYRSWVAMKSRCQGRSSNTNNTGRNYDQRGIKVCIGLQTFESFIEVVGEQPPDKRDIDRINNDGHYSCGYCTECITKDWPTNIQWATRRENLRHTRRNRMLTLNDVTHCVAEWAEALGWDEELIRSRLRKNWSDEKILTTPSPEHRTLTWNGQTKTLREWSLVTGLDLNVIYARYKRRVPAERILTTPVQTQHRPKRSVPRRRILSS